MTPEKIALVRSSWQQVLPIKDSAAQLFYGQLFELDPSLRSMFKGDMTEQGRKLMTMINMVVMSLDNLAPLLGAVEDLGRRHGSALRHRGKRADLDPGQGAGTAVHPGGRGRLGGSL